MEVKYNVSGERRKAMVKVVSEAHEELPEEKALAEEQENTAEADTLSISLPKETFTDVALENLDHLLESKGTLIKKAFGIEEATYTLAEDKVTFK